MSRSAAVLSCSRFITETDHDTVRREIALHNYDLHFNWYGNCSECTFTSPGPVIEMKSCTPSLNHWVIVSRPGRSQGLLYKQHCDSFVHSLSD